MKPAKCLCYVMFLFLCFVKAFMVLTIHNIK